VERFADITPDNVRLKGEAGDKLQATVRIVPQEKYPFKIVASRAGDGRNIRFELQEEAGGYLLTIINLKADPGRYRDTVYLETDSKLKPTIGVNVHAVIEKVKIAGVTPPRIVIRGRQGNVPEGSARIVPKEGQRLRITEARMEKGDDIRLTLAEAQQGETTVYTVTVESLRKQGGHFRDTVRLKTDSEVEPEIRIPVLVVVK
jgi:hypothetical protein